MTKKTTISAVKDCDIRGRYPEEVNEVLFFNLGKAFGRRVMTSVNAEPARATVVVGCDARLSTPSLKENFLKGLQAYNLQITDLGVVPTPLVYWAKERLQAQASAIITASHNPPEFNGLKVMIGERPPTPDMIKELADETEKDDISPPFSPRFVIPWPEALAIYKSEMIAELIELLGGSRDETVTEDYIALV